MSWPLVERRRGDRPPDGPDRRVGSGSLDDLIEANGLLHSLQRLAVTISSSLDEDEVIHRGIEQARALVHADAITVLLVDSYGQWRSVGGPSDVDQTNPDLDARVLDCIDSNRAVTVEGHPVWPSANVGVYRALRSRGDLLGLIAAEWLPGNTPTAAQSEALVGVADAMAIALDNSRIFGRLAERAAADERARMARELHDRVASSLAALGYDLDGLAREAPDNERIAQTRRRLTSTIEELRGILDDLRTGRDGLGFSEDSVRDLIARVRSRSAVEIDLVGKFAPIEEPVGTELMLLLSEALLNVERHSGADRASVSVMHEHGRLEIRVSDNGRGLGDSREGHGMRGMRERAEWIGASIRIDSSTSGTSIAVTLEGEH